MRQQYSQTSLRLWKSGHAQSTHVRPKRGVSGFPPHFTRTRGVCPTYVRHWRSRRARVRRAQGRTLQGVAFERLCAAKQLTPKINIIIMWRTVSQEYSLLLKPAMKLSHRISFWWRKAKNESGTNGNEKSFSAAKIECLPTPRLAVAEDVFKEKNVFCL